jgi:hypothetical protein
MRTMTWYLESSSKQTPYLFESNRATQVARFFLVLSLFAEEGGEKGWRGAGKEAFEPLKVCVLCYSWTAINS